MQKFSRIIKCPKCENEEKLEINALIAWAYLHEKKIQCSSCQEWVYLSMNPLLSALDIFILMPAIAFSLVLVVINILWGSYLNSLVYILIFFITAIIRARIIFFGNPVLMVKK